MISFYHLNSPLPLKEIIRIWIHLVSGLESESPSRTKMFIKNLLFIFLLGSLPFVALAQEGKEKVWLQLFPVISCDFPVSVLSYSVCKTCFEILKLQLGTYYSWDVERSTAKVFFDGQSWVHEEGILCARGERAGQAGRISLLSPPGAHTAGSASSDWLQLALGGVMLWK